MKTGNIKMICFIILFTIPPVCLAEDAVVAPYMGQEPPGLTPKVFSPGFISMPERCEHSLCLSKDGRECYFSVRAANWSTAEIMVTRIENGQWTTPVRASFSNTQTVCPSLADNDQSLYFTRNVDIYRVHRTDQGWSAPELLPAPANSSREEYSCHISNLGNLWTCSWRTGGVGGCDQWRIRLVDGQFTQAVDLTTINTTADDCNPVPGPDESYVIWNSTRPGGFGNMDLYISFADGQGGWTSPRNLGPTINTSKLEAGPYISPDHKYLFFSRSDTYTDSSIYWIRVEAFLPDPNGPVFNLSTGQRFATIQNAVNYAQTGQIILISPGTYNESLTLPNTALTIRSANPQDSAVVSLTILSGSGTSPVVTLAPGNNLRSLQGLTLTGGSDGIACSGSQLQACYCVLTGNLDCGIEISNVSTAILEHCIIAGNAGSGLHSLPKTGSRAGTVFSKVDIANCTIVQNVQYGLQGDGINVKSSILYANGASANAQINGNNVNVSYCDVQGGGLSGGNIDADPCFVQLGTWSDSKYAPGDNHLKSTAGHWNPWTCSWVVDDVNSPCIDAGDPNSPLDFEALGQCGDVINMGAYGGTPEASRTTVE
jgi:hypothetical protein